MRIVLLLAFAALSASAQTNVAVPADPLAAVSNSPAETVKPVRSEPMRSALKKSGWIAFKTAGSFAAKS